MDHACILAFTIFEGSYSTAISPMGEVGAHWAIEHYYFSLLAVHFAHNRSQGLLSTHLSLRAVCLAPDESCGNVTFSVFLIQLKHICLHEGRGA